MIETKNITLATGESEISVFQLQLIGYYALPCKWNGSDCNSRRILVHGTMYRRLRIGRDCHLDQSEADAISKLVREYGPWS